MNSAVAVAWIFVGLVIIAMDMREVARGSWDHRDKPLLILVVVCLAVVVLWPALIVGMKAAQLYGVWKKS